MRKSTVKKIRLIIALCFLSLCVTLSLADNVEATNLLSNGDFETGNLNFWAEDVFPDLSGSLCTTTAARTGTYGLWIYTSGAGTNAFSSIYQDVSANPDDVFTASAYIRTPEPGGGVDWVPGSYACIKVIFLSSSYDILATYESAYLTAETTPYNDPYTITAPQAPVGTAHIRFMCYVYEAGMSPGQSIANFDDCSLEKHLVAITSPPEGSVVSAGIIPVVGVIRDLSIETIDINGNEVGCYEGTWETTLAVVPGENVITATAVDAGSNVYADAVTITYDPNAPTGLFDIIYPGDGAVFYETPALVTATLSDPSNLYVNINGVEYLAGDGVLIARVPITAGSNTLELRCRDQADYEETQYLNVTFDTTGIDFGGIIANSSFENSAYPQKNWGRWNGNQSFLWEDGSASFISIAVAHTGSQSAGQVLYGSADRWGGVSQEFPVTPGDTINASGYVASFTGDDPFTTGAEAFIEIKYISNRGNEIEKYISEKITGPTDAWVQLSVSSVVPDGAETALFSFIQIGYDDATGKVYFDDAYVEIIPQGYTPEPKNPFDKPQSTGAVQLSGRTLLVNGEPFTIKGVCYQPTPIGAVPWQYDIFGDADIYNRDLPFLRAMNMNAIRTYGVVTSTDFLDACYNGGVNPIYVVMGYYIDGYSDLSNPAIRNAIKNDFRNYVSTYKNHPAVLMWSPGNETEWAYGGKDRDLFTLLNELAEVAYIEEGASYHPVTAVIEGVEEIGDNGLFTTDDDMDYIDVWGGNVYEGITFGDMFDDFAHRSKKPFWISEYGIDAYHVTSYHFDGEGHTVDTGYVNERKQAEWIAKLTVEIMSSDIAIGCMVFEYTDEWWKKGEPLIHDNRGSARDPRTNEWVFPDRFQNEEYWGIFSISEDGPDADTANDIEPRKVYSRLKDIFGNTPFTIVTSGGSIQDAVDDPASENAIFVEDGVYEEDNDVIEVKDDKRVIGIGDASDIIIHGRVLFKESNGEVNNFTIIYPEAEFIEFQNVFYSEGLYILNDAGVTVIDSQAEIKNCIIKPDLDGINARGGYDPALIIYGKGIQIWNLYHSADADINIQNNLILNADTGIHLFSQAFGGAINGYIQNNTLDNHRYAIVMRMHRESPVIKNNIISNSYDGIHLTYETLLDDRLSKIINNDLWNTNNIWCDEGAQSILIADPGLGAGNISEDPDYDFLDNYLPLNPNCSDKGYR